MSSFSVPWRKRFAQLRNKLYFYPPPEPMPRTRLFWVGTGLVSVAVLLFCAYFILLLLGRHDVFQTNAEDLGIMDQAIWNALHGNMLHQTVCNILTDTNCYSQDGINRFAIHFEPILFPVSLLYLLWPTPKTLLVLQTVIVSLGAFPAFWLARLRLRNDLAGVIFAVIYLLYPAQQQATVYDFHAVTFTAAFLLFVLYFMYIRRTVPMFVFALLAMACKEEIPLVVAMFGLWSMFFQRQWRSGFLLFTLGAAWGAAVLLYVIPHFSPTGQPLLSGRYNQLGKGPLEILKNVVQHPSDFLKQYVLQSDRIAYLRVLFQPAGYLLLLAPWVLIMALPSLAVNMLTSNKQMYTGLFQYNAEIVPVLIFASIEGIVVLLWLVRVIFGWLEQLGASGEPAQASSGSSARGMQSFMLRWRPVLILHVALLVVLLGWSLSSTVKADYSGFNGQLPISKGFSWPIASTHTALAQRFIDMVPQDASVSAQSKLVPHISHRQQIYMFPYGTGVKVQNLLTGATAENTARVDYILLDVTSDVYPYYGSPGYVNDVKTVMLSGNYGIQAAQDGYLLLKRGLPATSVAPYSVARPGANNEKVLLALPPEFCSFIYATPQDVVKNPMKATFTAPGGKLDQVGFEVLAPLIFSRSSGYVSVASFWQVPRQVTAVLQIQYFMQGSNGSTYSGTNEVSALSWCPTNTWLPGATVKLTSRVFQVSQHLPNGLAYMSMAIVPFDLSSNTIMEKDGRATWLPVQVVNGPPKVKPIAGINALQLEPMTIVP